MWKNNVFRFGITFLLCLQYSLLRETNYSTIVKPLPVIFWFFIVLFSEKRPEAKWVLFSLFSAFIGDILLDLGEDWLKIATIPFLGSTALLALAFHFRLRNNITKPVHGKDFLLLLPIATAFILLHLTLAPHLEDAAKIGAVLFTLAVLLLWRSLAVLLFKNNAEDTNFRRWMGVIGALGIVANYVLYSVNLSVQPIPRDLVIQVYYWGQAFAAWSFLNHKPFILGRKTEKFQPLK